MVFESVKVVINFEFWITAPTWLILPCMNCLPVDEPPAHGLDHFSFNCFFNRGFHMKRYCTMLALLLLVSAVPTRALAQANSMSFGGKAIAVDMTSCSPENSSDGKSRAMAATNGASASSMTIQFSTLNPASGKYTTVVDGDALSAGKVLIGAAGKSFGKGGVLAKAGQEITVVKTGAAYQASFSDLAMQGMASKAAVEQKLSASFGCT
jgi:hypothetical protein